jgi:hypothetical protein
MDSPLERVRIPTAPSNVISVSCERAPLMLKPPVPNEKLNPPVLPPRTARLQLRQVHGVATVQLKIADLLAFDDLAERSDSVCNSDAVAVTSTVSVTAPTCSTALMLAGTLDRLLLSRDSNFLEAGDFDGNCVQFRTARSGSNTIAFRGRRFANQAGCLVFHNDLRARQLPNPKDR